VADEFEIFGQRLTGSNAAEIGPNDFRLSDLGPDGDPSFDAEVPDLAPVASTRQVLIVWQGNDATTDGVEIWGQRWTWDNPTAVAVIGLRATRGRRGVVVSWRAATEIGLVGFNVWREAPGRRLIRLNRRLLPAVLDGVRGITHGFVDRSPPPGPATYRLQAVLHDGTKVWGGVASFTR
jgi:hypothetical protein